jgi:hypothetical protein
VQPFPAPELQSAVFPGAQAENRTQQFTVAQSQTWLSSMYTGWHQPLA